MLPIQLLDETQYDQVMNKTVIPALSAHLTEFDLPAVGGGTIRCRFYEAKSARKCVVISHGFCESGLKFQEIVWYLLVQGVSVLCPDHRGHGHSLREGARDGTIVYIQHFDDYAQDLCAAALSVRDKLPADCEMLLLGHSMGGAIAARVLELYPNLFARCVLSSPMLSMNTAPATPSLGLLLSGFFVLTGQGKRRFWVQKPYSPEEKFEASCCTSPERFAWYAALRRDNPALRTNAASYRWIWESLRAQKRILKPEELAKIQTPTLVMQAEWDALVRPEGQEAFVRSVECAHLCRVSGVKHEIYRSPNAQLRPYLQAVFGFLLDGALPENAAKA